MKLSSTNSDEASKNKNPNLVIGASRLYVSLSNFGLVLVVLFAVLFFHFLKMVSYTANKTATQKRPTTATADKTATKPQHDFAVCGLRF